MHAFITLALSAVLASTTAMAPAAPGTKPAVQNQVAQAQPAATTPAAKPAQPKICKRLSQGKVCMTAKKWKEYDEM